MKKIKAHTIVDEIAKWFININIIKDIKDIRHLDDKKIIDRYLNIIQHNEIDLQNKIPSCILIKETY